MNPEGWTGVDLDATLAEYDHWRGPEHIGAPIMPMVERVQRWLAAGRDVRIFTARVCSAQPRGDLVKAVAAIDAWCLKHIGRCLPITSEKDYMMHVLYDDRAVRVEVNTGQLLSPE